MDDELERIEMTREERAFHEASHALTMSCLFPDVRYIASIAFTGEAGGYVKVLDDCNPNKIELLYIAYSGGVGQVMHLGLMQKVKTMSYDDRMTQICQHDFELAETMNPSEDDKTSVFKSLNEAIADNWELVSIIAHHLLEFETISSQYIARLIGLNHETQ